MSTLLDTIIMLSRDGFIVSMGTKGEEHVAVLYRNGAINNSDGGIIVRPEVQEQESFTNEQATEEHVMNVLLRLAIKANG